MPGHQGRCFVRDGRWYAQEVLGKWQCFEELRGGAFDAVGEFKSVGTDFRGALDYFDVIIPRYAAWKEGA